MPDYPILQQNKPIGTLTVTQEGLFTVFSARAKTDADRLRLAVCGERSRAYLGLMLPDGSGWRTLRRRLTRLERARLPEPILFAADETWDIPDAPALPPDPPRAPRWGATAGRPAPGTEPVAACGAGGTKPWLRGEKPGLDAPKTAALLPSGGAAVEVPAEKPRNGGWPDVGWMKLGEAKGTCAVPCMGAEK